MVAIDPGSWFPLILTVWNGSKESSGTELGVSVCVCVCLCEGGVRVKIKNSM